MSGWVGWVGREGGAPKQGVCMTGILHACMHAIQGRLEGRASRRAPCPAAAKTPPRPASPPAPPPSVPSLCAQLVRLGVGVVHHLERARGLFYHPVLRAAVGAGPRALAAVQQALEHGLALHALQARAAQAAAARGGEGGATSGAAAPATTAAAAAGGRGRGEQQPAGSSGSKQQRARACAPQEHAPVLWCQQYARAALADGLQDLRTRGGRVGGGEGAGKGRGTCRARPAHAPGAGRTQAGAPLSPYPAPHTRTHTRPCSHAPLNHTCTVALK